MLKDQANREPLPLGKPNKAFDALGFAKRYGLYILLLGSFLFAMLTPLIFVVKKPYYEVHALIRVDPVVPTVLKNTEDTSIISYYSRYVNTTATAMKTNDMLTKALDGMEPKQREKLFAKGIPTETCTAILQSIVTVEPDGSSHVMDLKISGSRPDGLAEFLNSLMNTYIEETRKSSNTSNGDRLSFLYTQKNIITTEIATIERDLDSLTKDIGTSSFSEAFNTARKSSEVLALAYNNAMNERLSAETGFRAVKQSSTEEKKIVLDPLFEEIVLNNGGLNLTESWTNQRLQELRGTTDGLTAINPDRISVEEKMKSMNAYAAQLRNEVRAKAQHIILGKRDIESAKSLITARNSYEAARAREDTLRIALTEKEKEAKRISIGLHKGEYLAAKWQDKFDQLNNIDKRITEIEIEKKVPSRITVLSVARRPNQPLKSNINKITMMLLAVSFGLVGGAFAAYELSSDRIRSSRDIKHALGHPPVQTIVNLRKPNTEDTDQYSLAPDDFRSHQIGSLAIKLYKEKTTENAKTLLFTGTDKGVGSSSITMSCAKALAQLVPKVLIIDADIEKAPIEENDEFQICLPGLFDYLTGRTTLEESIVSTPGDNIDMMYAGNITSSSVPRQKITELINELRKPYDFICIDGAPLLHSHLVEQFAIHSDIVALIALGDSSKFRELRKAAELLVLLGVPAIAPILNFGGISKSPSVAEMFDNPPEFLKKVLPEKTRRTIRNIPGGLQLIDRLLETARQFQPAKE